MDLVTNRVARRSVATALLGVVLVAVAACGGDDDDTAAGADRPAAAENGEGESPAPRTGSGGASSGTLTYGDETIELASVRCYLEEQPRAGLGGTFELSVQASGTTAAGEPLIVDITRVHPDPEAAFGEDEPFDHVNLDVGDTTYTGSGEVGTVTLDGSALTTSGFEVGSLTGAEESVVSFDLSCG